MTWCIVRVVAVVVTLCVRVTTNHPAPSSYSIAIQYTPNVTTAQGTLRGVVMQHNSRRLPLVAQYKGIPYAAPPVGPLRFMPPRRAPDFLHDANNPYNVLNTFGPVCPQKFPDTKKMTPQRREEFLKLKQHLMDQSEDCLYLNIYAPYPGQHERSRKYPVVVFIHGESFEWNSGNPYDGSVLAAYGKVVVVTLNYRLGVLGFLKTGLEEHSTSNFNFGLVDQIAALEWIKANIDAFGGDPNLVTLLGHGTGAVCASLLMLSPIVGNKKLSHRAILMGGSALSDWALAASPRDVTYQVAKALNCQIQDEEAFIACLQRKRLTELLAVSPTTVPYRTRFGPIVDAMVLPNDPEKLMTTYTDIFSRFELMYGVTEMESVHLLSPEALEVGLLETDRDQELRKYLRSKCEMRSELCVTRTLEEYGSSQGYRAEEGYTGTEPDRALLNRDALLDILSDARTVAPMVQMAKYHARLNAQSYFYVFTHKTEKKQHLRDKSSTGDELPYVFGVPLGGSSFHFTDRYTDKERFFSEIIMTYFCNFAYTGNPNVPRKNEYHTLGDDEWITYHSNWPEFDREQQQYIRLDIPAHHLDHYREDKMNYWNDEFRALSRNSTYSLPKQPPKPGPVFPPKNPPPWILTRPPGKPFDRYENFHKPLVSSTSYGTIRITGTAAPDNMMNGKVYGTVVNSPDSDNMGTSTAITIAMGSVFLLSNVCLFLILYLRCYRKKKLRSEAEKCDEHVTGDEDSAQMKLIPGCNFIKMVGKSSRSDDTYEAVKSSGSKLKVPRQMSTSTIDAHTKVRDWITNEIVYKYSPRFLRRPRQGRKSPEPKPETPTNDSTLGRSPTRPVSPADEDRHRPPLIKSSSIPVQKSKRIEKVSVAIDATPSGRGNSVLAQQPIELTKSLDRPNFDPPLRRSLTLDDFSVIKPTTTTKDLRKSTTSINLKLAEAPMVIRIAHAHSKSDPVQDTYHNPKKLRTFDPHVDVNVTSRDEDQYKLPLTPEESLMTIKRRNFPKVLPDYPSREALAKKRRSMPVANHLFTTIPEVPNQAAKLPPAPPLRTTSTLSRKVGGPPPQPVCVSAPMLAQEPPPSPEPEVACNNLYVGPLIPRAGLSSSESSRLNTQPIYDSLRAAAAATEKRGGGKAVAKTIITTDPNQPIKKIEPKVIIKPTMARSGSDAKKSNIPRVVIHDSLVEDDKGKRVAAKASHIPTPLVKGAAKESSSSESTPSEESDTGTVVKKM